MTRLAAALAAALLAGCAAAPSPSIERTISEEMVIEVAEMTGLQYRRDILPTVEFVSRQRMDRIAARSPLAQSCAAGRFNGHCKMFAGYDGRRNLIVIADDVSPAMQCAVAAHEVFHFLEGVGMQEHSEPAAYALQARWEARYPDGCEIMGGAR